MNSPKVLLFAVTDNDFMTHRLELIQGLLSHKYKVILVANPGPASEKLEAMGARYIPVSFNSRSSNPFEDIILAYRFKKIIQCERPNIVLTFYTKTNIYGSIASRWCNIPYISTITGLGTALEYPGIMQRLMVMLYRYALKKACNVIYQNKPNMDFMHASQVRRDLGLLVAGSGVNLQKFEYVKYPEPDDIQFLFLSRVMKEKGIDEYIAAATYFNKVNPSIKFHIVGEATDYLDKIQNLHNKGIVYYHGKQSDVRPFINSCCCTIFPSFYPEGMANVILESEASGRPVITTSRAGCAESVEDGVTGFIVESQNANALIAKIRDFLSLSYEQRELMGKNARKKMEREFDRRNIVDSYISEIKKVLQ